MTKTFGTLAALALLGTCPMWADGLQLAGPLARTGNGFGANARALTIQSHGPSHNVESGCVAPGPVVGAGACMPGGYNWGGDEVNPTGFPKISAPTVSSLGITDGSQVGILFDGVQPQNANNSYVNIDDLTLKLYSQGNLVWSASGSWSNLDTNPGNGTSDYLFVLDPNAVSSFNAALGGNGSDVLALDSTISFARQSGGPDSYSLVNTNPNLSSVAPTPEPSSLALLGTGMFAVAFWMYQNKRREAEAVL